MRLIPSALAAHLATGATTLCHCWRVQRADGAVLGFTDHDQDLTFDGDLYRAATGLTASRREISLGLAIDDASVAGILSDESLTEADLAKGLYDGAEIRIYRVNWSAPSERVLLAVAHTGEVVRSSEHFTAELKGLAHRLDAAEGRLYRFGCDVDLGDSRCGVDLASPLMRGEGVVSAVLGGGRAFSASGLSAFAGSFFERGRLLWTSGANLGHAAEVKRHEVNSGIVNLETWLAPPFPLAVGDSFTVTAGCDKQFTTCRVKFSNAKRFRGFPHMPGNDWILSYPSEAEVMDGGSRFR